MKDNYSASERVFWEMIENHPEVKQARDDFYATRKKIIKQHQYILDEILCKKIKKNKKKKI